MYGRLNYLRFFLAWSVLAYHSMLEFFPLAGMLAVWGFFLISGYLVSDILHGRYQGRYRDFLVNRFLRIFPVYWFALLVGVLLIAVQPEVSPANHMRVYEPATYGEWWRNIVLFGAVGSSYGKWIVAPAGSLSIELTWYLIFFIGAFFPVRALLVFYSFFIALPFVISPVFKVPVELFGSGFAFALGAIAFHVPMRLPNAVHIAALVAMLASMFIWPLVFDYSPFDADRWRHWWIFVLVTVLLWLAMPWLVVRSSVGSFSNLLGDLSYPLFLFHTFAGVLVCMYSDIQPQTWQFLLVVTVLSLVMSYLVVLVVERPIAIIRTRIRNRDLPAVTPAADVDGRLSSGAG